MPRMSEILGGAHWDVLTSLMGNRIPDVNFGVVADLPGASAAVEVCYGCLLPGAGWTRVATSLPGEIRILQSAFEPGTAAGLALEAHEITHQVQMWGHPGFLDRYAIAEMKNSAANLPPYMNPLEWPAYVKEAQVYRQALAMGFPPGKRIPLLIAYGAGQLDARRGLFSTRQ